MLPVTPGPAAPPSDASGSSRPHDAQTLGATTPAVSIQVIRARMRRRHHARAAVAAAPGRCFSVKARFALEMASTHSRIMVCSHPVNHEVP